MKNLLSVLLFLSSASYASVREGAYKIDPDHSNIGFEVSHLGISFVVGRFNKMSGEVKFTPNGDSSVKVEVDTASVDTKVAQRDQHLRSADFFNVAQFPKANFVSTGVEYDGEGNPKLIRGNLTLHGQTNPVTLTVSPVGNGDGPLGDYRAGFHAVATIKRSDYGMRNMLAVAGDEITLTIHVEAIRQ